MTDYAELHTHSYFSLLDGASSPEVLVQQAQALGLAGLALTDHDSLAGAVRFWIAARAAGLHAVIGAEVTLEDGHHLTLLAETQAGYANLCRLVTRARLDVVEGHSPRRHGGGTEGHGGKIGEAAFDLDNWPGKVEPSLAYVRLAELSDGLIALSGCRQGAVAASLLKGDDRGAHAAVERLAGIFERDHLYIEIQHHYLPDDQRLNRQLVAIAQAFELPLVATNNVHYAANADKPLHDALVATRHNETLAEAQRAGHLPANSAFALASPDEMTRRFRGYPKAIANQALANSVAISERCRASLDFSDRRLPEFALPDDWHSPHAGYDDSVFAYLYQLCHESLPRRYPHLKPAVLTQLAHELDIIEQAGLAGYFLIVWDIVRYAKEIGVRCQGRGSAANSIVAYLLGITSIDPLQHNLLFERFLSRDKFTTPDIDIDFATGLELDAGGFETSESRISRSGVTRDSSLVFCQDESDCVDPLRMTGCGSADFGVPNGDAPRIDALRIDGREAVIQYVYRRYGRAHTAMVCNVVTYRARSAVRDLSKALGFPNAVIDRLAGSIDTRSPAVAAEQILAQMGQDEPSEAASEKTAVAIHPLALLADLLRRIEGCPRHLSIHSGGMLITGLPLDEIVPLEPATMPGRVVCQWDKESVEDAGLIKIDLLGLRTLGLITRALDYVEEVEGQRLDLDAVPLNDPAIYEMLQRGDTVGAFQVESRAQQQMLPRLKPTCFEDIIVEVAIVRPGPIQGGAVHPYLRRREGLEPVSFLHPSLEPALAETLGVLLFQEQAIRVAVEAAGFSPGEADMLRRALSRSRSDEAMAALRLRFIQGAQARGIDFAVAEPIFTQLSGFAGYGFCKSHAASFALIAYQTLYLKQHHTAAFYCAIFNSQPMGFYSPEVIAGDARRHGVDLLPPEINRSLWDYAIERDERGRLALRVGLATVQSLGRQAWTAIEAARNEQPFKDLADLCRRTRLHPDIIANLIRGGALDAFGKRRDLLWQLGDMDYRPDEFELNLPTQPVALPALDAPEQTAWEYELLGLSPERQLFVHYREVLRKQNVRSTWQVKQARPGERLQVAGLVAVRQRPSTAKGILFISLEDESGLLDLVVKPNVYDRLRDVLRNHPLIVVTGIVQRGGSAVSLLVFDARPLEGKE